MIMNYNHYLFIILLLNLLFNKAVFASRGDNHYFYRACLQNCKQINCTTPYSLQEFHEKQAIFESIFQWSCYDECSYDCMWKTVNLMQSKGEPVAQFHGKWPFKRILGIQEPASTLFSILNLLSNYIFGYRALRSQLVLGIHRLYPMWMIFCLISMNAWIWSTVFHTRDKTLTEIFDYIAAISLVFSQFGCCLIRIGYRTNYRRFSLLATMALFVYFLYHAYYLLFVKMDFGYNMTVNVIVGLCNVICWLSWSVYRYISGKVYVWRCALSVLLAMSFAILELFDFAPCAWTIDAHSLWHASTIILPMLWYRFVIDDSKYLLMYVN